MCMLLRGRLCTHRHLSHPMGAWVVVCATVHVQPNALTSATKGWMCATVCPGALLFCSVLFCSVLCSPRCTQTCVGRHGGVVSVRAYGSPVVRWGVLICTSRSVVPRPGTTLLLVQAFFGSHMGDWHQLSYHVHAASCILHLGLVVVGLSNRGVWSHELCMHIHGVHTAHVCRKQLCCKIFPNGADRVLEPRRSKPGDGSNGHYVFWQLAKTPTTPLRKTSWY